MYGVCVNRLKPNEQNGETGQSPVGLLARLDDVEIMLYSLKSGDVIWLSPADNPLTKEFFYIQSGALELMLDDETVRLTAGESFTASGLIEDVRVATDCDTTVINVVTAPTFDTAVDFENKLKKLLLQINEKDNYTYQHSGNVMRYSVKLYEALKKGSESVTMDDLVVASLFHDVGKCFVPDEVLKKRGALERSEARFIARHPLDSARLLRPRFGEHVAEIAFNHHEREDGSGYPRGLSGDEISLPAKIVAVADAFDAMTTDRGYNTVKTFDEAAAELAALDEQYDLKVTRALCELVRAGALQPEEGGGNETV